MIKEIIIIILCVFLILISIYIIMEHIRKVNNDYILGNIKQLPWYIPSNWILDYWIITWVFITKNIIYFKTQL